uniref:tRNA:m(4)X modification enzyme TRM13 n=1 Tax=Kryptolebias marmoratus TaxID=37003 RepID=A0A3Q3A1S1_KRYMA
MVTTHLDKPYSSEEAEPVMASILGHLEDLGLLQRGRCFVEFGAGRGKLSHWIHEDLQLLLVERSSTRFKVDGKHQDTGAEFERLQVDIQHLDLRKVPLLQQKKLPLVGVGKHLCGAATDLALRCLLETSKVREETEPAPKRLRSSEPRPGEDPETSEPGPGTGPVLGMALALCCHHRCEWRHYVGQQFFLQRGLGPAEFSAFCRMSSWATCGFRLSNQDCPSQDPTNQRVEHEGHKPAAETDAVTGLLSAAERQHVGRLCKLMIDGGRHHFLKTKGFSSKLIRYVEPQVTLENILLTAVPSCPALS